MFCGFVAEMGPRLRIAEMRKHYVAVMALFLSLSTASLSAQTDKKISVSLIYEAIAATNATLWLAEDAKLFEKYGLDTKVVHARGAVPVQALVSGSVEFGAFSGSSAIAAVLAGSDLVFVAAKGNFAVMSFWVRRDSPIKMLANLKGKTIGVTRAGSATHTIARIALKSAGLSERDVKFLHHGGLPESFASLDQGIVDASLGSPPRPGFRELVDLSSQDSVSAGRDRAATQLPPEPARNGTQSAQSIPRDHQARQRKARARDGIHLQAHESAARTRSSGVSAA